jgi:cysteine desulfurase
MKFSIFKKNKESEITERIHLDYAATTPVHNDVLDAMRPYWSHKWANASAIYKEGVEIREKIEDERMRLARTLRVRASGITFTSGGTEANNLAILGTIARLQNEGKENRNIEIITTKVEHPSVQKTASHLEKLGVSIKYVSVDEEGLIDLLELQSLLSKKTSLVTFAYVNSETGVIQDVKKISRTVRKWNESKKHNTLIHLDACQAPLWLSCALDSLGVDMISLDSGKCYGPKGVGVLVRKHDIELDPIMFGGSQEDGLHPGTENQAMIVGCAEAIVRAQEFHQERVKKIQMIRDFGFKKIKEKLPHAVINGSLESRVANNINFSLPGIDSEYAVIVLDKHGVAASTKSACGSGKGIGSEVVREMTKDEERALSTIRFTLGEESSEKDIEYAISILEKHEEIMRKTF